MKKFRWFWETLTIKNKIRVFSISVFVAIMAAIIFDVWMVRLFTTDFGNIMVDNTSSGELVAAIERETEAFDAYVHSSDKADTAEWESSVRATGEAFANIRPDYGYLGEERFAILQSLQTAYEVYARARNQVISDYQSETLFVDKLYDVYHMQEYLGIYARRLMDETMFEGNMRYQNLTPVVVGIPFFVAALGIVLILTVLQISAAMNHSITDPVVTLAGASRKIASNDFFIEDVQVRNRDEIGELVSAFNKMKFATGEYIKALEEKREALDQLHAREMENLEIEKQLETMNLELLKSQINPHFLFNTLNVISGMANLEDAQTTERMIEALSSLFRYNLKNQAKECLLAQELKNSRDYMYLQEMRFGGRVEFEVDCEVDENKVCVPTFTLQPLLENAMIHGISPKVEGGKVFINVGEKDGKLQIRVGDTGVGMDEEMLSKVRKQLDGGEDTAIDADIVGIGLGNINRRVKAMYPGSRVDIYSKKDEGTDILIEIPVSEIEMRDVMAGEDETFSRSDDTAKED